MSYVAASEAVGDAELAQAIAHAKNAKEINALIAAYKQAQIEAYKVNEATEEGRAKNSMDLAESRIKSLEAVSSTYQTGLDIIASKEDSINKTYDKRMKALDKVLQMNQEIADSQRDQLTMADALSRGDIFAAAKAMADQKAKDSQKSAEAQKQALTDAKDAQVAGLTATINGKQMNREDIEKRIKDINDQILVIKQNEINKQNELIARKEYEAKLDIAKAARGKPPTTTSAGGNPAGGNPAGGGPDNGGGPKTNPKYTAQQKVVNDLQAAYNKVKKDVDTKNAVFEAQINKLKEQHKKLVPLTGRGVQAENARRAPLRLANERQQSSLQTSKAWTGKMLIEPAAKLNAATKKLSGIPKTLSNGGPSGRSPFAIGADIIPAMLAPGEFVMSAASVKKYGSDTMRAINEGRLEAGSKKDSAVSKKSFNPVYNINVDVAKTDAQPEEIASAVIRHLEGKNKAMMKGLIG
jgi:hypothetical protein